MIKDFNIWDNSLKEKIVEFKHNYSGITKVVINACYEYDYSKIAGETDITLDLINFTKEKNIELHILTATHSKHQLLPKHDHLYIHHWPTFWLTLTFTRLLYHSNYDYNKNLGLDVLDKEVGKNNPVLYPYITMNKRPKIHRALMMDMLACENIIDSGKVIWREWTPETHYTFRYWEQKIQLLDQTDMFVNQEIFPHEYANSFMQLVTESDETITTLSEKTVMPLMFNKPFLVAANPGFHNFLKDCGFLLYDELFNYDFDNEANIHARYHLIAKNIKKYVSMTTEELQKCYSNVFEKCAYNKKVAMKIATSTSLIPKIFKELAVHQVRNNIPDYPNDINNFIVSHEDEYRF